MPKKSAIPKVQEVPPPPAVQEVEAPKVTYGFLNKRRCPRCGGVNTEAYATNGQIQSRVCQAPTCRWRFKVTGEPI